jgi:hypothetical protein
LPFAPIRFKLAGVKPIVVVLPLLILISGLAVFFLLPLDLKTRSLILVSDVVGAGFVGFALWKKSQGG